MPSKTILLVPLNDLNVSVRGFKTVPSTGTKAAITTGTVTGFLATTPASDATAADPTLEASLSYIGTNSDGESGTYPAGTWLFQLDAAALTKSLLETHFAPLGKAYLIIKRDNAVRGVVVLDYKPYLSIPVAA
jgi:hypothetical protein